MNNPFKDSNLQTKNRYILPVPKETLQRIDKSSSPAHVGQLEYAIDLIVPEKTPVLAAADGIVTFVKDDSYTGGPYPDYWYDSNFIVIEHAKGEYSRYDHLAERSARARIGERVKAGQIIALSGMTGFTFLPHLHFQVFIFTGPNVWTDFQTLQIDKFEM